jgi:hypothetical protein
MTNRTPFVKVPLTQGKVALISPEDAERIRQHSWHAQKIVNTETPRKWMPCATVRVDGKKFRLKLHRFIMGFGPGDPDVDHINANNLDCRRSNLRACTDFENLMNLRKRRDSKSPYKGVALRKENGTWHAQIQAHGKIYRLGTYRTPEEAAHAYDDAARRLHGEFARLNFPREGERRA